MPASGPIIQIGESLLQLGSHRFGGMLIVSNDMYESASPTRAPKTVQLTERDLADAERILGLLIGNSETAGLRRPANMTGRSEQLVTRAAAILAERRRREQLFSASMFGEPAWEMLLNLYLTESSGVRLNVSRVTEASGSPPTTALRWLDYLENQRLVRRETHPTDGRASFVELTERAHDLLELYLSEPLTDHG